MDILVGLSGRWPSRLTRGQAMSREMCKQRLPHSAEGCWEASVSGLDRAHRPTHKFIFMCKTVTVEDQRDKWQFLGQTSKCCLPLWFPSSGLQEILLRSHTALCLNVRYLSQGHGNDKSQSILGKKACKYIYMYKVILEIGQCHCHIVFWEGRTWLYLLKLKKLCPLTKYFISSNLI